jgi:hypothetical protein
MYADMIKTFTDGRVNHFANPKVKAISTFIQNMFLSGNSSVSFSDSGKSAKYALSIVHYLKKTYPADVFAYDLAYSSIWLSDARISYALRAATWFDPEFAEHPDDIASDSVFFAKDTEWLIKKTAKYGFAAKGGNNKEFHNHNDVGSFIVAKNGKHIFTDPGSAIYTKQYFESKTRYDFLETQSLGHSVPIVNGCAQKVGAEYRAEKLSFENNVFSMDISAAYGIDNFKNLQRRFELSEGTVTLVDEFDGVGEVTERFILTCEPQFCQGYFAADGVKITPNAYDEYEITKVKLTRGEDIYILDFKLSKNEKIFALKIEV